MTSRKAVMSNTFKNTVVAIVESDAKTIEWAGALTSEHTPVNVATHRLSSSKANLAYADKYDVPFLQAHLLHNGQTVHVGAQ